MSRYATTFRDAPLNHLGSGGGFSGVTLWQVEATSGRFCLRATPLGNVIRERTLGLHRLLRHVSDCGVTISPVPVATRDGDTLPVAGDDAFQLEPWSPGIADFCANPSDIRLRAAMVALARWHQAAATFRVTRSERPWFFVADLQPSPGLGERLQVIAKWDAVTRGTVRRKLQSDESSEFRRLGMRVLELFERHAPDVTKELELARQIAVPLQPCLRDVWHDHLLFSGDEVTGLIDAHACRSDCVATDLARLLGSLIGNDRARWDFALNAYQQVRPLSLAELGLVELFDRSSVLLSGLTWLDWRCVQGRQLDRPERVIERLEHMLQRLKSLK